MKFLLLTLLSSITWVSPLGWLIIKSVSDSAYWLADLCCITVVTCCKCLTILLILCFTGGWLPSPRADRLIWWCNLPISQQWGCSRRPWLLGHIACTRWHRGRKDCPTECGVYLHRQKDCSVHRKPHMGECQRILFIPLRYVEERSEKSDCFYTQIENSSIFLKGKMLKTPVYKALFCRAKCRPPRYIII